MKNRSKWIALVLLIMWAAPLTCNAQAWHSVKGEALRSGLSGLRNEAFSLYEDENEAFQAYEAGRPRPWYNKLNSLLLKLKKDASVKRCILFISYDGRV